MTRRSQSSEPLSRKIQIFCTKKARPKQGNSKSRPTRTRLAKQPLNLPGREPANYRNRNHSPLPSGTDGSTQSRSFQASVFVQPSSRKGLADDWVQRVVWTPVQEDSNFCTKKARPKQGNPKSRPTPDTPCKTTKTAILQTKHSWRILTPTKGYYKQSMDLVRPTALTTAND